jgi:ribosomal protein S18 acetylase RimI-like enzyme
LRRYRAADRAAVRELHDLALVAAGAHGGSGEWDADLDEIERIYLEDRGEFLVGELDGRLVAMGALRRESETTARITRMRVHPGCQRRGFGRRVLERLELRAGELGYTELVLDTTVGQTAARALYASAGYRETGRSRVGRFEVIDMRRSLTDAGRPHGQL